MAKSTGVSQSLRGYDSWIDISSQYSSPPLSPVNGEIVTTGLSVQRPTLNRRRKKATIIDIQGTSSQDEYEESESDEDLLLSSSNEMVPRIPLTAPSPLESGSERDEKNSRDQTKVVDTQRDTISRQQPQQYLDQPHNSQMAYTQPSSIHRQYSHIVQNVFQQQSHRGPADHDAALRASLTTLLSNGAVAARGISKRELASDRVSTANERSQNVNESIGLRFISESELMAPPTLRQPVAHTMKPTKEDSSHSSLTEKKPIRGSNGNTQKGRGRNQKVSQGGLIPSNILTWAVSAGVLIIISVVGFGAGYIIGREVGKQESIYGLTGTPLGNDSTCARQAMRGGSDGLKRFKWSISGGSRSMIS